MMSLLKFEVLSSNSLTPTFKGYSMNNFIPKNMKTYSYMMSLSYLQKKLINIVVSMFMSFFILIYRFSRKMKICSGMMSIKKKR